MGPHFSLLILAAGRSKRMGTPKALLPFGTRRAIDLLVESARQARLEPVLVVSSEDVLSCAQSLRAHAVWNPSPELGRTHSVQIGLSHIDRERGCLIVPIDAPLISATTFTQIASADASWEIVRPRFAGRPGHPVRFGRASLEEVTKLGPDEPLHLVVRRVPERVLNLDVGDEECIANLNTPADYEAALKRFRSRATGCAP
ncbi:MAG: nucleotidyltransferase family protein [Planctomycetes bacterium]|nr:nucleotidyltransferase family protein [Planctomycetota bacterium]